jgi:GntR family transcriptional regulator, transcriptional repressor for pyruvate dehydrogenase complex
MAVDSEMSPQGEPVSAERVTARVVTYLLMLIDSGEIQPGNRLPPERELARRLKVSRPSLRTGIAFLGMIGMVKSCHGSGTYLSLGSPTLQPKAGLKLGGLRAPVSSQLFDACCVIEGTIAGLAAERPTSKLLAELAEEVAEMYAAINDPQRYSHHDVRFHRTIARAAGNAILEALLETLAANIYSSSCRAQPCHDLRQSAEMHHEIYRAIRSRNPIRAKLLMEQHLRGTFPFLETGDDIHALPKWRSDIEKVI